MFPAHDNAIKVFLTLSEDGKTLNCDSDHEMLLLNREIGDGISGISNSRN